MSTRIEHQLDFGRPLRFDSLDCRHTEEAVERIAALILD
jgi:hypothetical protein